MKLRVLAVVSTLVAVTAVAVSVRASIVQAQDKKGTVKIVQEEDQFTFTSSTFVDTGITTTITTKNNTLLLLRFASQASCRDDGGVAGCSGHVQILVDDIVTEPNEGSVFISQPGTVSGLTLSLGIDRASVGLGPGLHTVKVQVAASSLDQFTLLNSTLTVMAFRS